MNSRPIICLMLLMLTCVGLAADRAAQGAEGDVTRLSVSSTGIQGNNVSQAPAVSTDGRYVAFESNSSNLVSGDTNGCWDIFLRDRFAQTTTRVSVSSAGVQGNANSWSPSISGDGRYVVYMSLATNLVTGDTNGTWDIFLYDRTTRITSRVSVSSTGTQSDGECWYPKISSDGNHIAFSSPATNLVAGDTNDTWDVFVHTRVSGATVIGSLANNGDLANDASGGPSLSADGRYLAFHSAANNLVADDQNQVVDVFVRDLQEGTTVRASVATDGTEADGASSSPSISGDGQHVAFASDATNLVADDTNGLSDVFERDVVSEITERISVSTAGAQADGASGAPYLSDDGVYVLFQSAATNLVDGDTNGCDDVFVRIRSENETDRLSHSGLGVQANGACLTPVGSVESNIVIYSSVATNLVSGDTNGTSDVFALQVGEEPEYHDVAITGLRIYPRKWATGVVNQLAIMDVMNLGTRPETAARCKFMFDDDENFNDAATDPTPPVELGSKNDVTLAVGEKKKVQVALTPGWPPGYYYLQGRVEPTLGKTDVQRANNSKQGLIEMVAYDFKLADIDWNKSKSAIIITVLNEGPSRGFGRVSVIVAGTRLLYHGESDAYFFAEVGQSINIEFAYTPPSTAYRRIESRVYPTDGTPDVHPADNYRTETLRMP